MMIEQSIDELANKLRREISYDPCTGEMKRITKSGPNVKIGAIAGSVDHQGYRRISFTGKLMAAHRLAWLHYYGKWPEFTIDHINGVRDDNRIENLRDVIHAVNLQNLKGARSDSKLGIPGVRKRGNKYEARIMAYGKSIVIGCFVSQELAQEAYQKKKKEVHCVP